MEDRSWGIIRQSTIQSWQIGLTEKEALQIKAEHDEFVEKYKPGPYCTVQVIRVVSTPPKEKFGDTLKRLGIVNSKGKLTKKYR